MLMSIRTEVGEGKVKGMLSVRVFGGHWYVLPSLTDGERRLTPRCRQKEATKPGAQRRSIASSSSLDGKGRGPRPRKRAGNEVLLSVPACSRPLRQAEHILYTKGIYMSDLHGLKAGRTLCCGSALHNCKAEGKLELSLRGGA